MPVSDTVPSPARTPALVPGATASTASRVEVVPHADFCEAIVLYEFVC